MSLDPLTTIKKVEQFLREDVSQAVAPQLRSDVKAAAKLLNESVREIDQLAIRLYEECQTMAALCKRAVLQLYTTPIEAADVIDFSIWHSLSLTVQIECHRQVLQQFDHMLVALGDAAQQAGNRDVKLVALLTESIHLQTQFAKNRLPFQSVFKAV